MVAETSRPKLLFETGLPARYYVPPEDVREEMLVPSEKQTLCPYKGTASYRSLRIGSDLVEDFVWYYPEPTPDAMPTRRRSCTTRTRRTFRKL